jgi:hypothetical protein
MVEMPERGCLPAAAGLGQVAVMFVKVLPRHLLRILALVCLDDDVSDEVD